MFGIVAIVISGVSLILNIVGLAIPYWLYKKLGIGLESFTVKLGLWKFCVPPILSCSEIPDVYVDGTLKAVRAMEILGVLLIAGATVCAVLKLVAMKEQKLLPKVAGGLTSAAGFFVIVGCIIFAAKFKNDDKVIYNGSNIALDLHAGFGLCIVAGIGSIVASVLFFMDKDE